MNNEDNESRNPEDVNKQFRSIVTNPRVSTAAVGVWLRGADAQYRAQRPISFAELHETTGISERMIRFYVEQLVSEDFASVDPEEDCIEFSNPDIPKAEL
jgi:hypothetical protein